MNRLESPVRAGFGRHAGKPLGAAFAGIGGARGDPLLEDVDLRVAQLAAFFLGRHLEIVVGIRKRLEQKAVAGFAGNEGRPVFAALFPAGARVEREAALGFVFRVAVALIAALREQWPDLLLEEIELLFGGLRGSEGNGCRREERQRPAEAVGKWELSHRKLKSVPVRRQAMTPSTTLP